MARKAKPDPEAQRRNLSAARWAKANPEAVESEALRAERIAAWAALPLTRALAAELAGVALSRIGDPAASRGLLGLWGERSDTGFEAIRPAPPETEPDRPKAIRAAILRALSRVAVNPDGLSALAQAVEAARSVEPNRRLDPILPRIVETVNPAREAGKRLFGLVPPGEPEPKPGILPMFEAEPEALIRRVPLLALSDSAGRPTMGQGRGAPLDLRLPVEGMLAVDPADRWRESVRLAFTVRDLRDGLFPRGWTARRRTGKRPGDWQRVRDALFRARDFRIPLPSGGFWYAFALRREPGPAARLDDPVLVDIALPPESGPGPVIDRPALRLLGLDSGPRYRAFLAVEAANWIPGRTRVPTPKGQHPYGWSGRRTRYPVFRREDRRELAFGLADRKNRTRAQVDCAFADLPGCVVIGRREVDPRTGAVGWRIVPAAAAEAIRRRERRAR